jgi:hypothetical protein
MEYFEFKNQFILPENCNNYKCDFIYLNDALYINQLRKEPYTVTDTVTIYKVNSTSSSKYEFFLPSKDWITNVTVTDDRIIIIGFYNIYQYNISNNRPSYICYVENNTHFDEILYCSNNKLVLSRSCFTCDNPGSQVSILNLINNQYILSSSFDSPEGYQYLSFKPRRLIDYINNKFVVSDLTEYKLYFYDDSLNIINDISRFPKSWSYLSDLYTELDSLQRSTDIFNEHYIEMSYKNSSIHLVDFISDSLLLVCWSSYNSDSITNLRINYHYDIWRNINNNDWTLLMSDLSLELPDLDEKFNFKKFNGLSNNYSLKNNYLINTSYCPFLLNSIDLQHLTFRDINSKIKSYKKKLGFTNSVFIYKFHSKKS